MKRLAFYLSFLLVIAEIVACQPSTSTSDPVATGVAVQKAIAVTLTAEASRATPVPSPTKTPEPTVTSLAPSPTATSARTNAPTPTVTTTISSTMGVIHGVLVDQSGGQPVSDEFLLLGTITYDKNRQLLWGYISDQEGSLYRIRGAYTDAKGVFRIETPPGSYGLAARQLNLNSGLRIARDFTGAVLIIKVEAGQTVDLSTILVR